MDKLYSWTAKRAGGRITVYHSCGKITAVDTIAPENGKLVATVAGGKKFELVIA